jgi:hypothetical protein
MTMIFMTLPSLRRCRASRRVRAPSSLRVVRHALSVGHRSLLFSFIDFTTTDLVTFIATAFALVVVLVASPLTVWVLARIMWPDFEQTSTPRQRWLILGVVVGVGVVAFLLGLNQEHFLTCEDFTISGNSEPPAWVNATE